MNSTHNSRSWLIRLWIVAAAFSVVLIVRDLVNLEGFAIPGEIALGRDFVNVWTAGRAVLEGQTGLLYQIDAYREFQQAEIGYRLSGHNYSYPPLGLPLAVLFGLLPYPVALVLWLGLTGWLFVHASRPWLREAGLPGSLALLTSAALLNLWAGHYGFLIGALWLFGWRLLEDRPWLAGMCFGLIVIKPHLGLLIPVVLVIRKQWAAFFSASITVLGLLLVSLLFFGTQPWFDYLTMTSSEQASMIDAGAALFGAMSTSTATAMLAMGASLTVTIAMQGLVAILGLAMTIDAARRPGPFGPIGLLAATATFLILPYAFVYDLTVVSIAAVWLLHAHRQHLSRIGVAAVVAGIVAPQIGFALAFLTDLQLTPFMLLAFAYVQWQLIVRRSNEQKAELNALATGAA